MKTTNIEFLSYPSQYVLSPSPFLSLLNVTISSSKSFFLKMLPSMFTLQPSRGEGPRGRPCKCCISSPLLYFLPMMQRRTLHALSLSLPVAHSPFLSLPLASWFSLSMAFAFIFAICTPYTFCLAHYMDVLSLSLVIYCTRYFSR